jgi:hypothetical protein
MRNKKTKELSAYSSFLQPLECNPVVMKRDRDSVSGQF